MSPAHHFYCRPPPVIFVELCVKTKLAQVRAGRPGGGAGIMFLVLCPLVAVTTIMAPTQPFVPLSQETVIRKLNKDMEKPKIYGEVPMYKAFPH